MIAIMPRQPRGEGPNKRLSGALRPNTGEPPERVRHADACALAIKCARQHAAIRDGKRSEAGLEMSLMAPSSALSNGGRDRSECSSAESHGVQGGIEAAASIARWRCLKCLEVLAPQVIEGASTEADKVAGSDQILPRGNPCQGESSRGLFGTCPAGNALMCSEMISMRRVCLQVTGLRVFARYALLRWEQDIVIGAAIRVIESTDIFDADFVATAGSWEDFWQGEAGLDHEALREGLPGRDISNVTVRNEHEEFLPRHGREKGQAILGRYPEQDPDAGWSRAADAKCCLRRLHGLSVALRHDAPFKVLEQSPPCARRLPSARHRRAPVPSERAAYPEGCGDVQGGWERRIAARIGQRTGT